MVTLDLDKRVRCLDNQIYPDIVYSPGLDADKARKLYERLQSIERSIERNISVPEEKFKLYGRLNEIYFDWIGKLDVTNEELRIIEADVNYARKEIEIIELERAEQRALEADIYKKRKRLPVVKYQNGTEYRINSLDEWDKEEERFHEEERNRQELFEEIEPPDYSEPSLSPKQIVIVRRLEFLEIYGHSNSERSLERLEELENRLSLESDDWFKEELSHNIKMLRNSLLNPGILLKIKNK